METLRRARGTAKSGASGIIYTEKGGSRVVVVKVINNNTVSSVDENGREILLVGRGLGFHARTGQAVDRSKIEKIFRMDTPDSTDRLKQLFLEVDLEAIRAAVKIVDCARETLEKKLNKNLYITLTDHISFAADRQKQGLTFHNMLNLETRKLYPKEYAVGLRGLEIIRECMGLSLPEDEATSIALHVINAEYDCGMEQTTGVMRIIQQSLNIIRYTLHITFDEESLDYQRLLTHLLFFARRVVENRMNGGGDDFLCQAIRTRYPREFKCAQQIRDLVERDQGTVLPSDEIAFLCVHIARVARGQAADTEEPI